MYFQKSVIYLIKVNYTSYNYTPCNSTWTCLMYTAFDPEHQKQCSVFIRQKLNNQIINGRYSVVLHLSALYFSGQ